MFKKRDIYIIKFKEENFKYFNREVYITQSSKFQNCYWIKLINSEKFSSYKFSECFIRNGGKEILCHKDFLKLKKKIIREYGIVRFMRETSKKENKWNKIYLKPAEVFGVINQNLNNIVKKLVNKK